MLTSAGPGAISPLMPSKYYYTAAEHEASAPAAQSRNFDSVTLSSAPAGESRFHMEMVSRLSQEVRTATTTGDIHALRQQVSSGQYNPDPMTIAARILFLGEGA